MPIQDFFQGDDRIFAMFFCFFLNLLFLFGSFFCCWSDDFPLKLYSPSIVKWMSYHSFCVFLLEDSGLFFTTDNSFSPIFHKKDGVSWTSHLCV